MSPFQRPTPTSRWIQDSIVHASTQRAGEEGATRSSCEGELLSLRNPFLDRNRWDSRGTHRDCRGRSSKPLGRYLRDHPHRDSRLRTMRKIHRAPMRLDPHSGLLLLLLLLLCQITRGKGYRYLLRQMTRGKGIW